jgi:hypothetical protein
VARDDYGSYASVIDRIPEWWHDPHYLELREIPEGTWDNIAF